MGGWRQRSLQQSHGYKQDEWIQRIWSLWAHHNSQETSLIITFILKACNLGLVGLNVSITKRKAFLLDNILRILLSLILAVAMLYWPLMLVDQKAGIKVVTRVIEAFSCLSWELRPLIRMNTERSKCEMGRSSWVCLGVVCVIGHDSEHRLWHNKGFVNRASCLDDQALRCHFAQKLTLVESQPTWRTTVVDSLAFKPGTGRAFFLLSPEPLHEGFFSIQEFPSSRSGIKVR